MSNLTFYDRQKIEFYHNLKSFSLRDIGKIIGRDGSVIFREIARHKPQLGPYNAELAQAAACRKSKITNKKKLEKCPELARFIEDQLKEDWSPEQIAGRLKNHPPPELKKAKVRAVSMEAIYQYIYDQDGSIRLSKHLRRRHSNRKKQGSRVPRKICIPDRTPIYLRDEEINNKERLGDFEADMLCGKRGKEAVSVHFERKALAVFLEKLAGKDAPETTEALKRTIENLPAGFVKSITYDNGGENAEHVKIKAEYSIETFFCDAFAAWQKGGVENMNGLIRQYIPKKTDMATVTAEQLKFIQNRLNNRPRKTLDYLTPNEVLTNVK
jgi:transposase, IS30 family